MNGRVLFSGTVDDALRDDSPAHPWREARNPANQWLANIKGEAEAAREVIAAGECARAYVWAGLTPGLTREDMLAMARQAGAMGRRDVSQAIRDGWARHQEPQVTLAEHRASMARLTERIVEMHRNVAASVEAFAQWFNGQE